MVRPVRAGARLTGLKPSGGGEGRKFCDQGITTPISTIWWERSFDLGPLKAGGKEGVFRRTLGLVLFRSFRAAGGALSRLSDISHRGSMVGGGGGGGGWGGWGGGWGRGNGRPR